MDSNQQAWEHLEATRNSPTIRNRIEHGPSEFAAYLKHAKLSQAEYDQMDSWQKTTILRRCDEWLHSGADI